MMYLILCTDSELCPSRTSGAAGVARGADSVRGRCSGVASDPRGARERAGAGARRHAAVASATNAQQGVK